MQITAMKKDDFYRQMFKLTIPIIIQNLLSALCVSAQDGIKCAEFVRDQKPDGVRIEHTEDTLVEIMNEASGKGDALRRACRYLGGTAEEAAFIGDFFNDIVSESRHTCLIGHKECQQA